MEFELLYMIQNLHTQLLDLLMVTASKIGNVGIVWIAMALALMLTKQSRRCGVLMLVSMALCLLFGNLFLKNLIARDRPCWLDPSVPLLIPSPMIIRFHRDIPCMVLRLQRLYFCTIGAQES